MKIRNLLLPVLLLFLIQARGAEPVDSYLNALIRDAGSNLWWVYPKEIGGQTITPPKGGYIYRIKKDLNGDGVDELFLTTDEEIMKDGESWVLYRGSSSGIYEKVSDAVWLNGSLWVKTEGKLKKYSYVAPPESDTDIGGISTFWIDSSGKFQTITQPLTDAQSNAIDGGDQTLLGTNSLPDPNKIAEYLQLGSSFTFSIQKVLVGKLYQNANSTWRDVNKSFSLSQQYLDPADAADIASLNNWQPPK